MFSRGPTHPPCAPLPSLTLPDHTEVDLFSAICTARKPRFSESSLRRPHDPEQKGAICTPHGPPLQGFFRRHQRRICAAHQFEGAPLAPLLVWCSRGRNTRGSHAAIPKSVRTGHIQNGWEGKAEIDISFLWLLVPRATIWWFVWSAREPDPRFWPPVPLGGSNRSLEASKHVLIPQKPGPPGPCVGSKVTVSF